MCGIAGFLDPRAALAEPEALHRLAAMTDAIRHRGPDAGGAYVERAASGGAAVGLGHRRLSILDLSPAGAQPMTSHCGRWVIVFNGEIYNFEDLRREVEGRRGAVAWRSHSDTEVLLEAIAEIGPEATFARLDGMFALAVLDRATRSIVLARDPFGEKPLYYGLWKGVLLFGSELKALRAWPGFAPDEDPQALADYFKYCYVPAPASIFKGIRKLPAASWIRLDADIVQRGTLPAPAQYWDMVGAALAARARPFEGSFEEAVDAVEAALMESTRRRMVADVPLGALLSGGIDSSLTVAMMQACSSRKVRTFTIGMDEPGYNEADHARAVAKHLGTEHTELILTPESVQEVVPMIASVYDEPFADSSQIPTYIVSKMAREQVTVVLSGDGGDELFAGYNRYFHGPRLWERMQRVPRPVRQMVGKGLLAVPAGALDRMAEIAGRFAPGDLQAGRAAEKLHKVAVLLMAADRSGFHDQLLSPGGTVPMPGGGVRASVLPDREDPRNAQITYAEQAMLLDTANYLTDDVLTKVDRASMATSLEVRTPFLSRNLFEIAWGMPLAYKARAAQGKTLLREVLYRHVPKAVVDRPKAGFALPVARWLRGPLRGWAASLGATENESDKSLPAATAWASLVYQGWQKPI